MAKQSTHLLLYLAELEDPRRAQGKRHQLTSILLITIMSIMSGYIGYRAIGDFMRRNKKDLLDCLKPAHGKLPSFDVIRAVLMRIDFRAVSQQFYRWAQQYIQLSDNEWFSIDGKVIGGTVSNAHGLNQNFVSLVSLYCSKQKLVLGNAQVATSKQSEISVVQQLISTLHLSGVTLSMDALHCQKKRRK